MMEQVEDKRQAILDATLRLISQNGFHGTAMSKVAQEAGVSTGIIYHYFASKDELITELYKAIKSRSIAMLLENFDQNQPLKTQIRQLLENIIRYSIRHPRESAFVEQYVRSPYYHPDVDAALRACYQPILCCFEQAQAQMIIKELPYPVISAFTLDVATSLAQKQANGFINLTPALIEQVIEAAWEAIRQ